MPRLAAAAYPCCHARAGFAALAARPADAAGDAGCLAADNGRPMVPQMESTHGGLSVRSLTDAVRATAEEHQLAHEAALNERLIPGTFTAEMARKFEEARRWRIQAIEYALRASSGKQWTPEQYEYATEFYHGYLTHDIVFPPS
jgi:hypothetical protein